MKVIRSWIRRSIALLPKYFRYQIYRNLAIPAELSQEGLIFKLAQTKEELEESFRLLHDCYVEVGLMNSDQSGLRVTPYHALPSTVTLIAKVQNKVVATLSIVRDNPLGLPCEDFIDIKHLRSGGQRIAEISALAVLPGFRGQVLFYLFKFMYEWCVDYLGVDHIIATLTTESKAYELYEAVLFFNPISAKIETNYSFSNFRPVIAEHLDLKLAFSKFERHYSGLSDRRNLYTFFTQKKFPQLHYPERKFFQVDYPVMNKDLFQYFFLNRTDALNRMPTEKAVRLTTLIKTYFGDISEGLGGLPSNILYLWKNRPQIRYNTAIKAKLFFENLIPVDSLILNISDDGLCLAGDRLPEKTIIEANIAEGQLFRASLHRVWIDDEGKVAGYKVIVSDGVWKLMVNHFNASQTLAKAG